MAVRPRRNHWYQRTPAEAVRKWARGLGAGWKVKIHDPEKTDAPFAVVVWT